MTRQQDKKAEIAFWAKLTCEESPSMAWLSKHLQHINWKGLVLDAGCGQGNLALEVQKLAGEGRVEIIGVDLSLEMLELARSKTPFQFVLGDIESLPFADESFDIVICSETLHHFPNIEKASIELARVLKNNGQLLLVDHSTSFMNRLSYAIGGVYNRRSVNQTRSVNETLHSVKEYVSTFSRLNITEFTVIYVCNIPTLGEEIRYFKREPISGLSLLILIRALLRRLTLILPGSHGSNVIITAYKRVK